MGHTKDLTFDVLDMGGADEEGTVVVGDYMVSLGLRGDTVHVDTYLVYVDDSKHECWIECVTPWNYPADEYAGLTLQDWLHAHPNGSLRCRKASPSCTPVLVSKEYHSERDIMDVTLEHGLRNNLHGLVTVVRAAWEQTFAKKTEHKHAAHR